MWASTSLKSAWESFDGIPKFLAIDNFPAAVAGADASHPRLNRASLEPSHEFFLTSGLR